jgi:DNA-binding response OmpR family regulator
MCLMPKEIAVVEDDDTIREIIGLILEGDMYSLRLFADLQSFRRYLRDKVPDVIVLDIMLPDGNGIDESKFLKMNSATSRIPIILMSANRRVDPQELGLAAFIDKPFDIIDFRKAVETQII